MRAVLFTLFVVGFFSAVSFGDIYLTADVNMPDPNEEVTVWLHTDTPLLCMGTAIQIVGDANITDAMKDSDVDEYGWDNGWQCNPFIDDANGWAMVFGVDWAAEANDIIGYFKFRYYSGQVSVSIDDANSDAFGWDEEASYCPEVLFSTDVLTFGEGGDSMQGGQDFEQAAISEQPATSTKPQPQLMRCPANLVNKTSFRDVFKEDVWGGDEYAQDGGEGLMELDYEPNIIDVNSDITTNQIWTANNIYQITAPISVQALLVIEPGTVIGFLYEDSTPGVNNGGTLTVNNGGTLISKGTPDMPIIYTCDFLVQAWGEYWRHLSDYGPYYRGIYIESTASPATTITYSFIEGAVAGIVTDNVRLDHPIENNYLFGNIFGVMEYGTKHTDIKNNLCFSNGWSGIEVYLSDANGVGDANTVITIENNTCDYFQSDGIYIHGVMDVNQAGSVRLLNNIVSKSYGYGMHIFDVEDECAHITIANTGYYYNDAGNKNWDFEEYAPVEATSWPYSGNTYPLADHRLIQSCPFINAGRDYIEQTSLIGTTTDINGIPDNNFVDIGFHYSNWSYSNAGTGFAASDFNKDTITDYNDLCAFTSVWLDTVTAGTTGDLNNDANVNMIDFSLFAANWQKVQGEPNITPTISGDPNTGWIDIGLTGFAPDTQRVFVFNAGQYVGEIFGFRNGDTFGVDISKSGNQQNLKLAAINSTGGITCSDTTATVFPNSLNYCALSKSYEPNQPIRFAAYNTDIGDVNVNVYADGGNLVWSQSYSGNTVLGSIPASITNQYEIDYVSFAPSGGTAILSTTDPAEPDTLPPDPEVRALIVLPDGKIKLYDFRTISAVQTAFKNRGIKYKKLVTNSANYWNVAKYAETGNVKYLYIDAHGDYLDYVGDNGVFRTGVGLWGDWVVSVKRSDFQDPNQAPLWCDNLPGNLEQTRKSFAAMGFTSLEFVYFDCCYSGHLKINGSGLLVSGQEGFVGGFDGPHNDMSLALGIGETSRTRIYQGWYPIVPTRLQIWPFETDYQKWSRIEWQRLGAGDNLPEALTYTINQQTEFGDDAPVNNYRLKGQGFLDDIELNGY